jgi:hypothetical protein
LGLKILVAIAGVVSISAAFRIRVLRYLAISAFSLPTLAAPPTEASYFFIWCNAYGAPCVCVCVRGRERERERKGE